LIDPDRLHHRAHAISTKALLIYLQIILVFTVSLYLISLKKPRILGTVTFSPDLIIQYTNDVRAQNGLVSLTKNDLLAKAAAAKAQNMFAEDYWAHNSPKGETPWSFILASGYKYVFAGENLARDFDNPRTVVDAWMNSPSHKSNLLDKNFREIGVAVTDGRLTGHEGILVVQMFGSSGGQLSDIGSQSLGIASGQNPSVVKEAGQSVVLAKSKFSLARYSSLILIGFIFFLFLLEVLITAKRSNVHLKSGVWAHLALLAAVLFAVWYAVGGAVI